MQSSEACLVALVVLLIVFVAWSLRSGRAAAADAPAAPAGAPPLQPPPYYAGGAPGAPRGAPAPQPRKDFRTRNGHYVDPARLSEAEQQAWTPYNPYAAPSYDPQRDVSPGDSLAQSTDAVHEGDWNQRLSEFAVDPQTIANHLEWADNVGPFSQTAMIADDLDEAVAMSSGPPRMGITSFRRHAVAQGPCMQSITELGPADQEKHFSTFNFNGRSSSFDF